MRLRFVHISLTVLAMVGLAGAASAERPFGPPRGGPRDPGSFIQDHAERLGFDAETQARIEEIVERSHTRAAELEASLDEARHDLRELLDQDAPDEDAVMQQAEVLGRIDTELHKLRLRTLMEIRSSLTPEQRAQLEALRDERREKHRTLRLACESDFEALCPDARHPRARMRCLRENTDRISTACSEALETLRQERPPRR